MLMHSKVLVFHTVLELASRNRPLSPVYFIQCLVGPGVSWTFALIHLYYECLFLCTMRALICHLMSSCCDRAKGHRVKSLQIAYSEVKHYKFWS